MENPPSKRVSLPSKSMAEVQPHTDKVFSDYEPSIGKHPLEHPANTGCFTSTSQTLAMLVKVRLKSIKIMTRILQSFLCTSLVLDSTRAAMPSLGIATEAVLLPSLLDDLTQHPRLYTNGLLLKMAMYS